MVRTLGALVISLCIIGATEPAQPDAPPIDLFFDAAQVDDRIARQALDQIGAQWKDGYTFLLTVSLEAGSHLGEKVGSGSTEAAAGLL